MTPPSSQAVDVRTSGGTAGPPFFSAPFFSWAMVAPRPSDKKAAITNRIVNTRATFFSINCLLVKFAHCPLNMALEKILLQTSYGNLEAVVQRNRYEHTGSWSPGTQQRLIPTGPANPNKRLSRSCRLLSIWPRSVSSTRQKRPFDCCFENCKAA